MVSVSKRLKERKAEFSVTHRILELGQQPISIEMFLAQALKMVFQIPRLALEPKGSVYLVSDETPGCLERIAVIGVKDLLRDHCAVVELDQCLCGKAARKKRIFFHKALRPDHSDYPCGVPDHGYFCVPILHRERLLGVINLYVPTGYRRRKADENFFQACAQAIASVIERKKVKARLQQEILVDPLTRTFHRLSFIEILEKTKKKGARQG